VRPARFTGLTINFTAMADSHDKHNEAIIFYPIENPVISHSYPQQVVPIA
jgi:hypothetical protein